MIPSTLKILFDREYIRFYRHHFASFRKPFLLAGLATLPLLLVTTGIPYAIREGISLFAEKENLDGVIFWMGVALAGVALRGGVDFSIKYLMTVSHIKMTYDLRSRLFQNLQGSQLSFFNRTHVGEIVNLLTNDVMFASMGPLQIFILYWSSPIQILALLLLLGYFNAPMLAIAVLGIAGILPVLHRIANGARKAEVRFLELHGKSIGSLVESLTNIKQIKSLNLEGRRSGDLVTWDQEIIHYRKISIFLSALMTPTAEIAGSIVLFLIAVFSYRSVHAGTLGFGDAVAGLVIAGMLHRPVSLFINTIVDMQRSRASVERISWNLDQNRSGNNQVQLEKPVRTVHFQKVSFSYDGKRPILGQVNLGLKAGDRVALTGESGSGKTTLVDLLLGLYPPSSGSIQINGSEIAEVSLSSLRNQVGIVNQEALLFKGTIRENIEVNHPDYSSEDWKRALDCSGVGKMIKKFPKGLDTDVGERGGLISGGERKRVAIARALLRPISILILDEATSEIDEKTEREILASLDKLPPEMILIMISHNDRSLEYCNRKLRIDRGNLFEVEGKSA